MFKITKRDRTKIEREVDEVLKIMAMTDRTSDDYEILLGHLETLHGLKSEERKWSVSRDTMAVIIANVGITILVLKHEDMHVITSKALGYLIKGRV